MKPSIMPIEWQSDYEVALEIGKEVHKPILLFFYRDGCEGCAKMEAITFPAPSVVNIVNAHFIPIRIDIREGEKLPHKYYRTPSFRVLDAQGNTIYHSLGWLPPLEFAPFLWMGLGHFYFDCRRYEEASEAFALLSEGYPRSGYLPECRFYLAVSRHMGSRDYDQFDEDWVALSPSYSDSLGAMHTRVSHLWIRKDRTPEQNPTNL